MGDMEVFDSWSPLFSSIVASSIWGLKPSVKVVWITMIALKNKSGFVAGSVPGLARLAAVSVEECREALATFEAPDPDSKCRKDEGRRIKTMDGGWMILGHERFQKRMHEISTRVGNAKRQAKFRDKNKPRRDMKPMGSERQFVAAVENGESGDRVERMTDPTDS